MSTTTFLTNCGDPLQTKTNPRDLDSQPSLHLPLLEALNRYRLMTMEAAQQLPAYVDHDSEQLDQLIQTGVKRKLWGQAWLHHGLKYIYRINPEQNLRTALTPHGPLTEPAKLRSYASLRFCLLSGRPRTRLTREELSRWIPGLDPHGLPGTYYLDAQAAGRLGLIRLDAGRSGRWDRVIESVREDIGEHFVNAAFRSLLQAGRFEITIISVLPQKAQRLVSTLQQHRDTQRVPVHVVAIPELLPLMPALAERRSSTSTPT